MFILGRHQIKDLVSIYQDWGLEYKEVWQLILDNPLLLNNYPFEVMPIKRRLFRYFKFTKEMGRLMIRQYPLVLLRYDIFYNAAPLAVLRPSLSLSRTDLNCLSMPLLLNFSSTSSQKSVPEVSSLSEPKNLSLSKISSISSK